MARVAWLKGKACAGELEEGRAGKGSVCIIGQDTCQLRGQVKVAISEGHHANHREDHKGRARPRRHLSSQSKPVGNGGPRVLLGDMGGREL